MILPIRYKTEFYASLNAWFAINISFQVPNNFFCFVNRRGRLNFDEYASDTFNAVDFCRRLIFRAGKIVSLPLNGIILITSRFGERIHPVLKKEMLHGGIDLRADYEMVNTIANGIIVSFVERDIVGGDCMFHVKFYVII